MRIITSIFAMLLGAIGAVFGIMTIGGLIFAGVSSGTFLTQTSEAITQNIQELNSNADAVRAQVQNLRSSAVNEIRIDVNTLYQTPADETIDTSAVIAKIERDIEPQLQQINSYVASLLSYLDAFAAPTNNISQYLPATIRELFASRNVRNEVQGKLEQMQQDFTASKEGLRNAQFSNQLPLQELQALNDIDNLMQETESLLDNVETSLGAVSGQISGAAQQNIRNYLIGAIVVIGLLIWWGTWAQWALMRSGWRGLRGRDRNY